LAQRIKVQILDDAKMGDIALATHFLDLKQISDPTRNGMTLKQFKILDCPFNGTEMPEPINPFCRVNRMFI